MKTHRSLFRSLTAVAAASMLAACQGGSASPPAFPPQTPGNATQSAVRSVQSHKAGTPSISASPASLEFTADQAAAGTPQTVTISAKSDGKLSVSIAGTGNCPAVSPATIKPKRTDEEGGSDRDHRDAASGVITVTPAGPGPATCTITVASTARHGDDDNDGDHHGNRSGHDRDREHHDGDNDVSVSITIPVIVDAPATPPPTPAPTPTPGR